MTLYKLPEWPGLIEISNKIFEDIDSNEQRAAKTREETVRMLAIIEI
jgi:hypothetical protein